jgi:hypothetical protein
MKYVPPSIGETAFNCPHCSALAKQFWHSIRADQLSEESPLPLTIAEGDGRDWAFSGIEDDEEREEWLTWLAEMKKGLPFLKYRSGGSNHFKDVFNLSISRCYNVSAVCGPPGFILTG